MQKMSFMQRNNRIQQQNANYVDITIAIVVYQAFAFQHQLIEIILIENVLENYIEIVQHL